MSIEVIDIGDIVLCDECNQDYTESDEQGGIIFSGSAYCPTCADRIVKLAEKYRETEYIEARCPEGMSFGNFVRGVRTNNNITIETID